MVEPVLPQTGKLIQEKLREKQAMFNFFRAVLFVATLSLQGLDYTICRRGLLPDERLAE
jgi:hypothetical protein